MRDILRKAGQMVAEEEARRIVLERARALGTEEVPVVEALGAVLAEEVTADVDIPPFNRAAMDGYAVRLTDVAAAPVELTVIEHIKAGDVAQRPVGAGEASEIMTGAPVPEGAEAVVPLEYTEPLGEDRVRICQNVRGATNIARQAEDLTRGQMVFGPGRLLRPVEVGLLAAVGRTRVRVHRRPQVAVLATGDELVEPSEFPRPGETRNCNSFLLLAECARVGCPAVSLGIARDNQRDLEAKIRAGLEKDVLLVSGGVSVGKYDLVPKVFAALAVEVHFSEVAIKPGKPTVFATHGGKLVFGLPGNPVSVLVAFRLFAEPALKRLAGHTSVLPRMISVTLTAPGGKRGDRRSYLPARLREKNEQWFAEPVMTHGSADLMAVCQADALIRLEAGTGEVTAGTQVLALPLTM